MSETENAYHEKKAYEQIHDSGNGFRYDLPMKYKQILLCMCMMLCACGKAETKNEEKIYESADFTAVVVSDLHYTSSPSVFNSIVPLEPLGPEVTDALIAQVIDLSPDAFILTGDNTNNGRTEDVKELALKLKTVKDAGIEVIMATGNHDYGQADMKPYEQYFLPLLNMKEKDPSSYSYVSENQNVRIFAMDDSHAWGSDGLFGEETMKWLEGQLAKANQDHRRILFLSHHNILCGKTEKMYSSYLVQNEGLYEMLKQADVRLCMSGHQHNQAVYAFEDMYEILNGMPYSAPHTFGLLNIDDEGVNYETKEIDFAKYGSADLQSRCEEFITRQSESFMSTFVTLCKEKNLNEEETEKVITLVSAFFDAQGRGILADEAENILNDPSYGLMQKVLWDKNYGPWIEEMLKNPPADGSSLSFRW